MPGNRDFASLVVLSYKRPDHMERMFQSLMHAQTDTPWELIVVDDGSRDPNWPRLVQRLRMRDLSTVVFNAGVNLGVGVGMNRGFSIARGKWVVKLDADLEFSNHWLDRGIDLLERFPKVAVVGFFDYRNYVATDTRFNKLSPLESEGAVLGYVVDDFVGSAFMLRREDWLTHGVIDGKWRGFEESSDAFAEDVEWKKRMQAMGFDLAITARDVMSNFGFGLGNSTVVVPDTEGKGVVAKIGKEPVMFGGRRVKA